MSEDSSLRVETQEIVPNVTATASATEDAPSTTYEGFHYSYVYPRGFPGMVQSMLTILVIALFILTFIAQPYRIPTASMEDTLLVGDFLLVNKALYAPPGVWSHLHLLPYRNIQHDDVIVFHYPVDPTTHLVKRVVALPKDRIRLIGGRVWVNDKLANEPFTIYVPSFPSAFRDDFPSKLYTDPGVNTQWWREMHQDVQQDVLTVPTNRYFVLGDNRNDSLDSRYWGFVPRQNIVGQPFLVYFSLRERALPEIDGLPEDRLAHGHNWWAQLTSMARWDRMFHVIR